MINRGHVVVTRTGSWFDADGNRVENSAERENPQRTATDWDYLQEPAIWGVQPVSVANWLGFSAAAGRQSSPFLGEQTHRHAWVPCWFLLLLTIPLPVIGWRSWRGQRRVRAGCCVRCGYDLRATPERCPECGTVPHTVTVPQ